MTEDADLRLVAYCGLYCGTCAQRVRLPNQASALTETLHEEGFDDFYQYVPGMKENFPIFWQFLGSLTRFDCSCRDGNGGPPDCRIRACARMKNVRVCPECENYPCAHTDTLAEHYPTLITDGRRMQRTGLDKWIEEQKERARRGFAYSDVRFK